MGKIILVSPSPCPLVSAPAVALWLCGKFIRVHVAWFELERYCKSGFTGGKFCAENEKGRLVGLEPVLPLLTPLFSIHFKSSKYTFDI